MRQVARKKNRTRPLQSKTRPVTAPVRLSCPFARDVEAPSFPGGPVSILLPNRIPDGKTCKKIGNPVIFALFTLDRSGHLCYRQHVT